MKQMQHDSRLFRSDGPPVDEKRSITFAYMHIDGIGTVTAKLVDSLEIMRQFDLKYLVVMCDPRLLGIRRENGPKTVEMQQPDFIESLVLQFQDKLPKTASAPTPANFIITTKKCYEAKMERMVPRLCGSLNESRRVPAQPNNQHEVTLYYDLKEVGSAIDKYFRTLSSEVYVTLRG